jgi:WD40 repeat protein
MRIVAFVLMAVVASGCGQAPPARPLAARVTEIPEVNTTGAYVDTIALSRDGSRVAIGQRNGSIRVWTPASGTEPATFGVSRQAVSDLAFAPSGDLLASLGVYREGTLRLWRPGVSPSAWTEMASLRVGQRCASTAWASAWPSCACARSSSSTSPDRPRSPASRARTARS